jgi:hypothetical protein
MDFRLLKKITLFIIVSTFLAVLIFFALLVRSTRVSILNYTEQEICLISAKSGDSVHIEKLELTETGAKGFSLMFKDRVFVLYRPGQCNSELEDRKFVCDLENENGLDCEIIIRKDDESSCHCRDL